jgi:hypothetical protein
VAIVNQNFVDAFLSEAHPIGRRFRTIAGNTPGPWRTVVGVVPNIMQGDPRHGSRSSPSPTFPVIALRHD